MVEALVRHHLVRVVGDRYALLDSVAAYAAERLRADSKALRSAEIAHGHAYARLGQEPYLDTLRANAPTTAAAVREIDNLEVASARAVQRGDVDVAEATGARGGE